MSKSVVMVFSKYAVNGCWKSGSIACQNCCLVVTEELIFPVTVPGICT